MNNGHLSRQAFVGVALLVTAAIVVIAISGALVGVLFAIGLTVGLVIGLPLAVWVGPLAWMWWMNRRLEATDADTRSPDEMRAFEATINQLEPVDEGPVRSLLPLKISALAGSGRVELIALEVRDGGGLIPLTIQHSSDGPRPGPYAEVAMTDDLGTEYTAAGWGVASASREWRRTEIRFAPPPPEAAVVLAIRITEFLDPHIRPSGARFVGPWEFQVTLR
jgi:hypothetical protein